MENNSNHDPSALPLYPKGNPNPERVGFVMPGVIDATIADLTEAIARVAELLGQPPHFVDESGYEHDIIAAAFRGEGKDFVWIECVSKELERHVDVTFRLKANVKDQIAIDWVVETYNPYFGCRVGYLAWHDDRVVVIYRDKHHTYACSLPISGPITRVQMSDEWIIQRGQIIFVSRNLDAIERLSLPELIQLPSLSPDEARSEGNLPPRYDALCAAHLAFQKRRAEHLRQGGFLRKLKRFFGV